jgi:hypothetical protein
MCLVILQAGIVVDYFINIRFYANNHLLLVQVEYYFSDANLSTNDYLMKFVSKDPEGFGKEAFYYLNQSTS